MDWNFRNDQPIYSQLTQRLTEAIVSGIAAAAAFAQAIRARTRRSGVFPAHGGTVRHGK